MPIICPTITAYSEEDYHTQMEKVAGFATRIQIDLTDGVFTKEKTVSPEQAWWPVGVKADFHLMYRDPASAVKTVMEHQPNLVIMQAEAEGSFRSLSDFCRSHGTRVGIALLQDTKAETIFSALDLIDHVLVFSGNLGYQGGSHADLSLLSKVSQLKEKKPELEIGWDGGVNPQNVAELVSGGVDVLNVGGYLQSAEDPEKAYRGLVRIAEETGTT